MSQKVITVFGATGLQGGSVLKALIKSDQFLVRAITRNAKSEKAMQLATLKNVTVQQADLNDRPSIDKCIKGSYGTFLVTDLALDEKTSKETQQGFNLIDSAIKNKVSHVIFSGMDNASLTINKPCIHMDNKEKIEEYGMKKRDKINFTSLRLPMYYQVIPGLFAKKVTPNEFILTFPMSDKPVYCFDVNETGECVNTIFSRSKQFKSMIVEIAGDQLNGTEMANIMSKHLRPKRFTYGNVSLEAFKSFGFPGAEELANMFEYFQTGKMNRDIAFTKKLNPSTLNFNEWIDKNKQDIEKILDNAH